MIKAVVFDCFGVLVEESWTPFRDLHFKKGGDEYNWANEQMQQVSRGGITGDEFIRIVAEKADVSEGELKKLLHTNPVNKVLLNFIRTTLRSHYKIGFLSNVGNDRLHELFTDDELSLFDTVVLSYEIGVAKPDPQAFEITAHRLATATQDCLFVDDTEKFCEGARRVGMQAIRYEDFEKFQGSLAQLNI